MQNSRKEPQERIARHVLIRYSIPPTFDAAVPARWDVAGAWIARRWA
jgi:hypothetical protein